MSRTIQSEVEKKKKDAEPQYTADMKTKIAEFEKVAKEEMKRENQCNRPARDSRPSKASKRRDSKKSRKKKEQSSSENSEESDLSEQDESDRDDMDDDDDDDEDEQPVPKQKKKKKQHVEDLIFCQMYVLLSVIRAVLNLSGKEIGGLMEMNLQPDVVASENILHRSFCVSIRPLHAGPQTPPRSWSWKSQGESAE